MKTIKITVIRKACYEDLIMQYENPLKNPCDLKEGQVFLIDEVKKPDNFCESAWMNLYPYVFALAHGAEDIYSGWMKNKKSAMVSCNDGFRPVSFLLEVLD